MKTSLHKRSGSQARHAAGVVQGSHSVTCGRLKTREWKTLEWKSWHHTTVVENAREYINQCLNLTSRRLRTLLIPPTAYTAVGRLSSNHLLVLHQTLHSKLRRCGIGSTSVYYNANDIRISLRYFQSIQSAINYWKLRFPYFSFSREFHSRVFYSREFSVSLPAHSCLFMNGINRPLPPQSKLVLIYE